MPSQLKLQRLQQESPEFPITGPFGGIQSEGSSVKLELAGFIDCLNIMLRNGALGARLGVSSFSTIPSATAVRAFADFFTSTGIRTQTMISNTLYQLPGVLNNWAAVAGAFSASAYPASWTSVNGKLLFCQGIDQIQLWDGVAGAYAAASVTAPIAFFLNEIKTYAIAMSVVVGGVLNPYRVMGSLPGDPTSWGAGAPVGTFTTDLLDNLGPIQGSGKLNEILYIIRSYGVTQAIPTGSGLAPFNFVPFGDRGKGTRFPYSISTYGESEMVYVGDENIWWFTGSSYIPIGSMPGPDGKTRLGARSKIMVDLVNANLNQVTGFISGTTGQNNYKAYYLCIRLGTDPNFSVVWIYNFDEQNWTRNTYSSLAHVRIVPTIFGNLFQPGGPNFDSTAIGFTNGDGAFIDPSTDPFNLDTSGSIHGLLVLADRKHIKRINRVRFSYITTIAQTLTLILKNERNETITQNLVFSAPGTGLFETSIVFNITGPNIATSATPGFSGQFIDYTLNFPINTNPSFVIYEFSFYYEPESEFKNLS